MSEHWVYGAIGLLLVLHVIAVVRAYRKGQASGRAQASTENQTAGQGIECPDCGVVNGQRYRFCRQCVSELPGQVSVLESSSNPSERRTL
jgi:hypothetical protein